MELTGAIVSGTVSPVFKRTIDVIRFNAGVGMATGLANGGDGLSDAALSGIATYGSMKISNPVKSTVVSEAIQKVPVLVDEVDVICGADRCSKNDDGSIVYNGNNKLPRLSDAINPDKNKLASSLYGETGGFQSVKGEWNLHFMRIPYSWNRYRITIFTGELECRDWEYKYNRG